MYNDDLDPSVPDDERAGLVPIAARLSRERPVPAPAFRGSLRRRVVGDGRSQLDAVLRRRFAFALVSAGASLLAVAVAGVAGIGPLAPNVPGDALAGLMSVVL